MPKQPMTVEDVKEILKDAISHDMEKEIPEGYLLLVPFLLYKSALAFHQKEKVVSTVFLSPSNLYGIGDAKQCFIYKEK